ncbi:MAG: hypothetical protein CVV42_07410 [Candidatus Riflebacteria bacterium HGW-Riflebacteria-2]|jgi:hypothetical protein|nr:MAG: hypothetical protein CVV42_07410 [Candidatus Riflebacteria bacterium HGW-Riflebacteria-2]
MAIEDNENKVSDGSLTEDNLVWSSDKDPFVACKVSFETLPDGRFSIKSREISPAEVDYLILYKVYAVTGKNSKGQDQWNWIHQLSIFSEGSEFNVTRHIVLLPIRACAEKLAVALKTRLYINLEDKKHKDFYSITETTPGRNWDELNQPYYELLTKYQDEVLSESVQIPDTIKIHQGDKLLRISFSMPYVFSTYVPINKFGCAFALLMVLTGIYYGPRGSRGTVPDWLVTLDLFFLGMIVLRELYYRYVKYIKVEIKISAAGFDYRELYPGKPEGFGVKSKQVEEIQVIKKKGSIYTYSEFHLISDAQVFSFTLPPWYAEPVKRCIDKAFLLMNGGRSV